MDTVEAKLIESYTGKVGCQGTTELLQTPKYHLTYFNVRPVNFDNSTYIGRLTFSVPAVTRIVSHFIGHVLSKPKLVRINSNLRQKQIYPCHKVAQCFVCYKTLEDNKSHTTHRSAYLSVVTKIINVLHTQCNNLEKQKYKTDWKDYVGSETGTAFCL